MCQKITGLKLRHLLGFLFFLLLSFCFTSSFRTSLIIGVSLTNQGNAWSDCFLLIYPRISVLKVAVTWFRKLQTCSIVGFLLGWQSCCVQACPCIVWKFTLFLITSAKLHQSSSGYFFFWLWLHWYNKYGTKKERTEICCVLIKIQKNEVHSFLKRTVGSIWSSTSNRV